VKRILLSFIILYTFAVIPMQSKAALISDTIHVTHYGIHLDIGASTLNKIKGYTELSIIAKMNNVTNVSLNLLSLNVDSVIVNSLVKPFIYDGTTIKIPFNMMLN